MFRFRLQRLLDLREQREQVMAVEVARAEAAETAARSVLTGLETARSEGRARLIGDGDGTVGQLRNAAFVLDQLDRRLAEAATAVSAATEETSRTRDDLNVALQERRVLDRLRERREAEWRESEVQADRLVMDAIALTRFTQSVAAGRRGA